MLPEDGQELRLKHVGVIINNTTVQQIGVKYYICNIVPQKMFPIKYEDQPYKTVGTVTVV